MTTIARRVARGATAASFVSVALIGCGTEGDDRAASGVEFAPTSHFLTEAADSSARQPYRFSVSTTARNGATVWEGPAATGEFDGERTHILVDVEPAVPDGPIPGGVAREDLYIETVTNERMLYTHAPVIRAMQAEGSLSPSSPFASSPTADAVTSGWISVDVSQIENIDPAWAACVMAGQRTDPTAYFDLVAGADDIHDLGTDEIDGTTVHGLEGGVPLADLLRLARPDGDLPAGADVRPLEEMPIPIEVWVEPDGDIRRIEVRRDSDRIADALVEAGVVRAVDVLGEGPVIVETTEFWDHGDTSIAVDIPVDAADMTDELRDLLLGIPSAPMPMPGLDGDLALDAPAELDAIYDELGDMGTAPPYPEPEFSPPPPPSGGMSDAELDAELAELDAMYEELESMPDPESYELPPIPEIPPAPELPPPPPPPPLPPYQG